MTNKNRIFFTALCFYSISLFSQSPVVYTDKSHFSKVFGHTKEYRLYLPAGYESSDKHYPVIYFFHGWGGRHFKDDNALLEYEKIKTLVDKYQVLLVMWDGNIDTTEPRPYNTGNHENVKYEVQMKDYFPELITHIDAAYRTLTDRQHRGIIGFSMGGFMSFFLAGKYPEKISAAVSLAGSPEFFVGYPDNHTLYPVRYTFKNLQDVNIRMHNGDSDILYYLNDEVNEGAKWEGITLDYWKFHGPHMVDYAGETKVFESTMRFVTETFNKPITPKPRWSHYDLYPVFDVWGYSIRSNKNVPGYIYLRNVDKNGFGLYSNQWLPDGPPVTIDSITVKTPPIYVAGKKYSIVFYDKKTGKATINTQQADRTGSLSFFFKHTEIETGIYENANAASFLCVDYTVDKSNRFLHNNQSNLLSVKLLNRANNTSSSKIIVNLSTRDSSISIANKNITASIPVKSRIITLPPFHIKNNKKAPPHAEPSQVKFNLTIQSGNQSFSDDIIVPVLFDAPLFDSIQIDDQSPIREKAFGTGNGNRIAEAGEIIMIYSGTHRLRLYSENKWVSKEKVIDEMIPARWPDGFTVNSLITISPDCPDGHVIELYGSYETKEFNPIERKTHWGKIKLTIRKK